MDKQLSSNEDFANKELVFELTNQILKSADNPAEASETLASQLRELTGARIIAIYTFDDAQKLSLNFVSPERKKGSVLSTDYLDLVKKTCQKREISLYDTDLNSRHYEPLLNKIDLDISIGIPLWLGQKNLGCIMLLNLPSNYKINLVLDSLQSLSNVLGLVLRNAFLFEQQKQLLESSEAQMETLVNAREESIWSVSKDFCYLTFNSFYKRAYEAAYNHSLKVGENALNLLSGEQKDFWKEKYGKVLQGEKIVFEFDEVIFKQTLYFEVHLNPIFIDGEILGISAISSDITVRKNAELELAESETRFKSIFENIGLGVGLLNLKGKFVQVNEGMTKICGYSTEELLQMSNAEISHPEDIATTREKIMQLMQGKIQFFNEHKRLIHKDGSIIWIDLDVNPIYSIRGKIINVTGVMKDITSEKNIAKELAENELKYRLLADHTFDWEYWIDPEGKYTYISPSCERICGYPPEAFHKTPKLMLDLIHPNCSKDIASHYNQERKEPYHIEHIEFRIIHKNGQEVWIAHSCLPIKDDAGKFLGIRGVNRDITEQKETLEQLNILSSAVNQASVIVVITDPNGTIEYVNPYFTEITGYSFAEAVGDNPRILQSGHTTKEEYKKRWDTFKSGQNWRGEFLNKKKNGELYWEDATITPITDANGIIKHFVAIKEVITEKKELINDLVVAKEKAEESDKLKTEFLTNMSHEIRTPMNGIVGFSNLLGDSDAEPEDVKKFIGVIQKSSHQLLKIIDDILEISRLETKQVKAVKTEVNLNAICTELFDVFKLKNNSSPINFKLQTGLADDKSTVLTDEQKLKKILSNLLENAFKFTAEGEIILGYQLKGSLLELFVKDTGIGINPEAFVNIFDRFSQEEKEISQKSGGLGLGLSIAKENAELLGGKLRVESEKGKGASFFLSIPYQSVQKNNEVKEAIKKSPSTTEINHTILIAEDEEINFEYLNILLKKVGPNFNILHAWDGQEAVELCQSNPEINLVFMDIKMPRLNGYEATKQIKALRPNLPILAQTAYTSPEEIAKALEAGCNEFMSKPLNKHKIHQFVQQFLNVVL